LRCREDERNVDLHKPPLAVGVYELAGFAARHGRVELARRHDVELLEDLGTQGAGASAPEFREQRLGGWLPRCLRGVVGVDEHVGVHEHGPGRRKAHR